MEPLRLDKVTHWSIPVNDLDEAENFYKTILGLEHKGRLGNSTMSCFNLGDHFILLCQRNEPLVRTPQQDNRLHHAFDVSPKMFEKACHLFHQRGIPLAQPIVYREKGFFPGREIYFFDPSGNMLELRDPTWKPGMPTPTFEEITLSEGLA